MGEAQNEALVRVKKYMRIDDDGEDDIIQALYLAAEIYLDNAGIKKPQSENSLYNLALWGLTLYYYDHRDDVGNEYPFPKGLRPIINQLKNTKSQTPN